MAKQKQKSATMLSLAVASTLITVAVLLILAVLQNDSWAAEATQATPFPVRTPTTIPVASSPLTLTTIFDVDATNRERPVLTGILKVQVPITMTEVTVMRAYSPGDPEFDTAMTALVPDSWQLYAGSKDRKLLIENNIATLVVTYSGSLYLETRDYIYVSDAFITGQRQEGKMLLRIGTDTDASFNSMPEWTAWNVQVHLRAIEAVSVRPLPSKDNGEGQLSWTFKPDVPRENILLVTQIPGGTKSVVSIITGSNAWLALSETWPYLRSILHFVGPTIVLFVIYFVLRRRRKLPKVEGLQQVESRLLTAISWSIVLLLGVAILSQAQYVLESLTTHLPDGPVIQNFKQILDIDYRVKNLLLGSLILCASVILYLKANKTSNHRSSLWVAFWFLLGLTILYLPFFLTRFANRAGTDLLQHGAISQWSQAVWSWLPLLTIPFGAITYYSLAGLVRFAFGLTANRPQGSGVSEAGDEGVSVSKYWRYSNVLLWALVGTLLLGGAWHALAQAERFVEEYSFSTAPSVYEEFVSMLLLYPRVLIYYVIDLLPYLGLAGLIGVLFVMKDVVGTGGKSIFFTSHNKLGITLLVILFSGFVVGRDGWFFALGIPLSLLLSLLILPRLLSYGLEDVESRIRKKNSALANEQEDMVTAHRKEFLERAKALEDLERQETKLFEEYSEGKFTHKAYVVKLEEVKAEQERLKVGPPPEDTASNIPGSEEIGKKGAALPLWLSLVKLILFPPSKPPEDTSLPVKVRLPHDASPKDIALASGPATSWWENGVLAAKIGAGLALLPIAFYVYVLLTEDIVQLIPSSSYFGVLRVFSGLFRELAFWLVAAFVMGCLYPYLRFPFLPFNNGVLKGVALSLVYLMANSVVAVLTSWFAQGSGNAWFFRWLQLSLFLVVLGAILDYKSVKGSKLHWRYLIDHYNLTDARIAVTYLSPLVLALITVGQQVLSGSAQEAIKGVIEALPTAFPNVGGR